MRPAYPLNPHSSWPLAAVSFFEGFQTPAGRKITRARSCGRHLKPITDAELPAFSSDYRFRSESGRRPL
jgi:hypothetical protein